MTHAERCRTESTRDVIFLLQFRHSSFYAWTTESVWLDRAEAEQFRVAYGYRWKESQIYGVPSYGQLSDLLRRDPLLPCKWSLHPSYEGATDTDWRTSCGHDHFPYPSAPGQDGFQFCPYCGRGIELDTGGFPATSPPYR